MGMTSYNVYYATCNHCEKQYESNEEMVKKTELVESLKQEGWIIDELDDLIVCPECVKKELKKAMQMLKDEE